MFFLLNTSEPIVILIYTLIIAGTIYISREVKKPSIILIIMAAVIFLLINHSLMLDGLKSVEEDLISTVYRCIGMDLIFLLLTFISYLWVDDISAKANKKKSYDDSLSWFWEKL